MNIIKCFQFFISPLVLPLISNINQQKLYKYHFSYVFIYIFFLFHVFFYFYFFGFFSFFIILILGVGAAARKCHLKRFFWLNLIDYFWIFVRLSKIVWSFFHYSFEMLSNDKEYLQNSQKFRQILILSKYGSYWVIWILSLLQNHWH